MGEHRTTVGQPPPPTAGERRDRRRRYLALSAAAIIAALAASHLVHLGQDVPAAGYVTTAEYAEVRAPAAGQVARIDVRSGDTVHAGDLLVQLEDAAERAAVAEAEREMRRVEADLRLRESELAERRRQLACQVEAAALALDYARARLETTRRLAERGLASGREVEDDSHRVRVAEAEHRRLSQSDTGIDALNVEVLREEVAARREAVARARATLEARAVRAPIAGRVLRHTFYAGEVVRPDLLLYEVFDGEARVLKLRVPERYATRIATNQPVRALLRSDRVLLPGGGIPGRVVDVRDVIETDGPQAYRVVYAVLDADGRLIPPGANADARIRTGRAPFWKVLFDL